MAEKRTYKLLPLSNALSKVYKKSSKQNDSQFISLMRNWDNIVGLEYSKILIPIKSSSRNRSITIISDRNFSLESDYISPMLLEKINSFYGYPAFNKISFVFKNKNSNKSNISRNKAISVETKNKIEKIVCNIKDDALKESLRELGQSMSKKGKIK